MQYACGNALVCDTIDVARHVCYEKKQEVKAVTLEGTVFHKQGLITGGQTGEERSRRFEDHEIDGLNRLRDQLLGELKDLGKQRFELVKDDKLLAQVGRYEAELSTLKDELSSVEKRLKGARDELRVVEQQINETTPKRDATRTTLHTTENEADSLQAIADREDDAVFAQFCSRIGVANIREYEERQLKVMQQQSDARLEYERQMKRLEHQKTFEKRQLDEAEARVALNRRVIAKEEEKNRLPQEGQGAAGSGHRTDQEPHRRDSGPFGPAQDRGC
ncbi:hypothetical protein L7F22_047799 [Adiantum nelumboides]|nr:hypothetical protein [Adiantum nelumboides]